MVGISVTDAPVGRLIDGRYRIEAMVARGGMATVYRALDTRLGRTVALKVMHAELAADEEFVERFIREAHAAAKLSDPNAVAVFDQGEDDGAVYLAMEYIEGETLREALRSYDRLDPPVALEAIDAVLSALSSAHRAGIVHRDVKPENVLISTEGRVKVADFGLARAVSGPASDTRGILLGTVNYISPEQALGEPATARSDVYSAGIMLYELLTGTVPHTGPTDFVVVRSHIDKDVPPPSRLAPVPPVVDDLVRTATSRDPDERYADASRFLSAVRRARAALDGYEPADLVAEPVEAAGVGINDALGETAHHVAERDTPAAKPTPRPIPPPSHTRVIDHSAPSTESPPRQADRRDRVEEQLRLESARKAHSTRQQPNRRTAVFFVVLLAIALGVAIGAWWMGVGRWENTPSLLNLTPAAAKARAESEGFVADPAGDEYSESVPAGMILSTDPAPGERILEGDVIQFVVSLGPERHEVPNLEGMTLEQAEDALADRNLLADVSRKYDDTAKKGTVIEQEMDPGTKVRRHTEVPITVSKGPEPISIDDYTGQWAGDAEAALAAAGFLVAIEEVSSNDVEAGFVISQEPSAGTGTTGQTITLTVSKRGAVRVPDGLVGQKLADARATLQNAGFVVDVKTSGFSDKPSDNSRVISTSPLPGAQASSGSTVTVWVL